jgi:COMPASS component SPP1
MAEVEFDKEIKDQALQKLTKLEREIRKRVEDILDPQVHNAKMLEPSSPLSRPTVNGQSKHKPNGDLRKKGKKKKE